MRGCIKKRYKGTYSVIFDVETDAGQRKRKWVTVKGTRDDAQTKLNELLRQLDLHTYVDASKMTLAEWLTEWLALAKTRLRPATVTRYEAIITQRLTTASIGRMPLQKLRASHVEAYYASQTVSPATLMLDHAILHAALKKAVRDTLVPANVVANLDGRPKSGRRKWDEAEKHAWSAREAAAFLAVVKKDTPQTAAFYAMALDTGMRKGELGGLRWANVDLDAGTVRVIEQLRKTGSEPEWGPPKTDSSVRTIQIDAETVALLRGHKRTQAEIKLKNRGTYTDHGLVFAKEWTDVRRHGETLGQPLQLNNLGQRDYAKFIEAANVRRIKFHGLRHTCATLLLQAGTPVHIVSARLGHAKVAMTMEVYAHVLESDQKQAAETLGALLYRR